MARKSTDRIPTEGENRTRLEEIAEYQTTHKDPRKKYTASYTLNGTALSETILAETQQRALEILKYNCSLVGWQISNIEIVESV